MDTPDSASSSGKIYLVATTVIILFVSKPCIAEDDVVAETFVGTDNGAPAAASRDVDSLVAELDRTLRDCRDSHQAWTLRYEIAMTYFKGQRLNASKDKFKMISDEPNCPELIRIGSLNMVGVISRLLGEDDEALTAFSRLADSIEAEQSADNESNSDSTLMRLLCSALFNRAEILEKKRDYVAAICEYEHLLSLMKPNTGKEIRHAYGALAADRLSEIHLRRGQLADYVEATQALCSAYPQYYRTPLARLECECVKFLNKQGTNSDHSRGSFAGPAEVIGYLKESGDETSQSAVQQMLEKMTTEHKGTYAGLLIEYHYAWVLDALGQKEDAVRLLLNVSSAGIRNLHEAPGRIVETVRDYAGIQVAIILGEQGRYAEAMKALRNPNTGSEGSHISELMQSVRKAIELLRKEAPTNASATNHS